MTNKNEKTYVHIYTKNIKIYLQNLIHLNEITIFYNIRKIYLLKYILAKYMLNDIIYDEQLFNGYPDPRQTNTRHDKPLIDKH